MQSGVRALCGALACAALVLTGCSTASLAGANADPTTPRVLNLVAAENFWGSIASQLGGKQVKVTNIINSPDADPHEYEATASDGRAIATADLVVVNGLGYDTWASKLAEANPSPHRTMLDVGQVLGLPADANPHRWYDPTDVATVAAQITAAYKKADPADTTYFDEQHSAFTTTGLNDYHAAITDIKTGYAGTPVGASESIFAVLAPALGLDLRTPPSFLTATSQGTDPTAADITTVDRQISTKAITVYVYNSQNATPDIQAQIGAAKANGIPVTAITETMPEGTQSWQQWQTDQLTSLRDALATATGR